MNCFRDKMEISDENMVVPDSFFICPVCKGKAKSRAIKDLEEFDKIHQKCFEWFKIQKEKREILREMAFEPE